MKYAHVLRTELAAALVKVQGKIGAAGDEKSPNESPNDLRTIAKGR
jgi:hypothetical protein